MPIDERAIVATTSTQRWNAQHQSAIMTMIRTDTTSFVEAAMPDPHERPLDLEGQAPSVETHRC
jgi:hypothetical protein